MAWRIEFDPAVVAELAVLDQIIQRRIIRVLRERIAPLEDPRIVGEALRGRELGVFWKYRVGDYRLICRVEDKAIRILVIRIGHRREICR